MLISTDHEVLARIPTDLMLGGRKRYTAKVKCSPTRRWIATIHGGKDVTLWNEDTGEFRQALKHDYNVGFFVWSSCG